MSNIGSRAKVWNDNVHPYQENWKGTEVKIAPKDFIEMDYEDAVEFKSSMGHGMRVGNDGQALPESFKMIRIERGGSPQAPKDLGHRCMSCGNSYESPTMLDLHVTEQHKLELTDSKVADELQAKVNSRKKA